MYIIRFIISRHFNTLFYVYVVCVENSNYMCLCCGRCYGYLFYYTVKVYNFECIRSVSDLFVNLKEIAICSDKGGLVLQTVIPFLHRDSLFLQGDQNKQILSIDFYIVKNQKRYND